MNNNPVKIKDIAALSGVSTGTVDRVLHNRSDVSEKTREKVLKIIDELGYKTNIIAKSLALKKKINFYAIIPTKNKYSSYWEKPRDGILKAEEEFSKYGVKISFFLFDISNKDSFIIQYKKLLNKLPDAVVIAPVFKKETVEFVSELKKKKIPFVFLDSNLEEEKESTGYVGHDSYQSGKVAAKLIETRIANTANILLINLSAHPKNQNHLSQRSNGFRNYFSKKNRIGTMLEIDINNLNNKFIHEKLTHIFKNVSNIKAVFVTSSKAHIIGKYLYNKKMHHRVILVGYDLTDQNIKYLNNDTIDYLLSQNPVKQGFNSIKILFKSIVLNDLNKKNTYLPIDIIIKENVMYY